jgi:hypothetical protein
VNIFIPLSEIKIFGGEVCGMTLHDCMTAHTFVIPAKVDPCHFSDCPPPPSTLINTATKMARPGRIFYSSHDGIVNYGDVRKSQLPWMMFLCHQFFLIIFPNGEIVRTPE